MSSLFEPPYTIGWTRTRLIMLVRPTEMANSGVSSPIAVKVEIWIVQSEPNDLDFNFTLAMRLAHTVRKSRTFVIIVRPFVCIPPGTRAIRIIAICICDLSHGLEDSYSYRVYSSCELSLSKQERFSPLSIGSRPARTNEISSFNVEYLRICPGSATFVTGVFAFQKSNRNE